MSDVLAVLDKGNAHLVVGKHGAKAAGGPDPLADLFFGVLASRMSGDPSAEAGVLPVPAIEGKAEAAASIVAKPIVDAMAALVGDQAGLPAGEPADRAAGAQQPVPPLTQELIAAPMVAAQEEGTEHDLLLAQKNWANDGVQAALFPPMPVPPQVSSAGAGMANADEPVAAAPARSALVGEVLTNLGVSAAVPVRTERLAKAGVVAAIPAGEGQSLPTTLDRPTLLAQLSAQTATMQPGVLQGAVQLLEATAGDGRSVQATLTNASPAAESLMLRPFEHALRQADGKANLVVDAPLRSAAFPAEFADKIVWLAGRQGQFASLSLTPPHLGTVEVRLSVSGGEVAAQFFSPHASVRDAIEAALPKLRELMAGAGLSLGESQVQQEAFSQREGTGGAFSGGHVATPMQLEAMTGLAGAGATRGQGLVDLFV